MNLRALEPADTTFVTAQWNACRDALFFGALPPVTAVHVDTWIKQVRSHEAKLAVLSRSEGRLAGLCRLHGVSLVDGGASLATLFAETDRGGKLERETAALMIGHAFGTLNLHRLTVSLPAENGESIACFEALGFVREALRREDVYRSGRYHDVAVLGLLRDAAG